MSLSTFLPRLSRPGQVKPHLSQSELEWVGVDKKRRVAAVVQ